jgi:hypothetical protein
MELFDKKFVHFMWEDELAGKKGFFEDSINDLIIDVNECNCRGTVTVSESNAYPFQREETGITWAFFYYDPNYDCKRAYAEGKTIQYKQVDTWFVVTDPGWYDDIEYRIKPEEPKPRIMTYRELAEWLAKGNGQIKVGGEIHFWLDYVEGTDAMEVCYKIRRWGSEEWIEPTVDVYEADVKGIKGIENAAIKGLCSTHPNICKMIYNEGQKDIEKALKDKGVCLQSELDEAIAKLKEEECNLANKLLDSWCRNKDDYCPHLKALEEQIEEMKCCSNCKHSGEDNKSSTICDECFELCYWEMKE